MSLGVDHVDMRVPALVAVEKFYDAFAKQLGMTEKRYSKVGFGGSSWQDASPDDYNAVEYYAQAVPGKPRVFFGVIEEPDAQPAKSRIAFAVAEDELDEWLRVLPEIGAREIERGDPSYPAVFFTDPLGTRLEVCARRPGRERRAQVTKRDALLAVCSLAPPLADGACAWCGGELPARRRTWCSDRCGERSGRTTGGPSRGRARNAATAIAAGAAACARRSGRWQRAHRTRAAYLAAMRAWRGEPAASRLEVNHIDAVPRQASHARLRAPSRQPRDAVPAVPQRAHVGAARAAAL